MAVHQSLGRVVAGAVIAVAAATASGSAFAFIGILQQKVAALKVMTSQIATAAKAHINARTSIVQAEMAAMGMLSTTVEQLQLFQAFSIVSGQGAQVCDAVAQRNDIDTISMARDSYQFVAMPNSGRAAVPRDNYEVARADKQLDAYCSADEHNLGLCTSRFDGMANASTSFNKVMTMDQFTNKQLRAAEDYIANIVPAQRVAARTASSCDVSCQSSRLLALRANAAASMVATSMAMQLSGRIGEKTFAEKK